MKWIIEGVTYDTETATEIASGDHGSDLSQAWWTLYRTQSGVFFEVVAGHDGVVEEFRPLTNQQARRFLEVNANRLVEKYFGPMPEARPMQFSRRTVIAAAELMERLTHAEMTRYLLWLGVDFPRWVGGDSISMAKRVNNLIDLFHQRPERRLEDGRLLCDELVEKAVSLLPQTENEHPWDALPGITPAHTTFLRCLDLDGFTVAGGKLRRSLPVDFGLPEAQDEISHLLAKHNFAIAKGHLDQAFTAHTNGLWASANSQIRSFFDGLLDEIAVRIDPAATTAASGQPRRTKLAASGFFIRSLNEWDDDGRGFINGLTKRLHPHGSHPGLSDQDDSTFRLHTVLLAARLFLVRFDRWEMA